jgi:hypothetical protein
LAEEASSFSINFEHEYGVWRSYSLTFTAHIFCYLIHKLRTDTLHHIMNHMWYMKGVL